ncbi:MAG: hypothetical protein JJW01_03405 [Alphaproteobacteria bacterium]|nr:hypothetical protein [Rickettsiales bacterium]
MLFSVEIEFFLKTPDIILNVNTPLIKQLLDNIKTAGYKSDITVESIELEDGQNQFEIQTVPTDSPANLAKFISEIQNEHFKLYNNIDLTAKPMQNMPSSGMHFHISLYDCNDISLFGPINLHSAQYQEVLYYSVGGLMANNNRFITIFSPTNNCYKRYIPPLNKEFFKHNPTTLSWGINNRTCAIRIPRSITVLPSNTRIEHRICSPLANSYNALGAIILSITDGIVNKRNPPKPIFGDSFNPMYFNEAPRLPISLKETNNVVNKVDNLTSIQEEIKKIMLQSNQKK